MPVLENAYYVYFLADPRDDSIFYIGKGKGDRVRHHVKLAKRGRVDNAPKCLRICEILGAGLDVKEVIHRGGLTECEAFDLERALIEEHRDNGLTNIANGRISEMEAARAQAKWLRRRILPFEIWFNLLSDAKIAEFSRVFGDLRVFHRKFVAEIDALIQNPLSNLKSIKV